MPVSEEQLNRWAKAPSETEEGRCQHTVARITDAVRAKFGSSVSVFLQGSYKNRTNVRLDSDVDVVVCHDNYFADVDGLSESDKEIFWNNFIASEYTFARFKNEVQQVLEGEFGYTEIERKNKCIKVRKNSQRVDADVIPCFVHKRFKTPYQVEAEGIKFITDDGARISSFPEQHYKNGVQKNSDTDRMYKALVRIIKNIRNELVDQGTILEETMPSFFLECLVWNVLPNSHFQKETHHAATRAIIATVWNEMGEAERADNYAEVSDLKWLFKGSPHRTHQQARNFMQQVWNFIGYED